MATSVGCSGAAVSVVSSHSSWARDRRVGDDQAQRPEVDRVVERRVPLAGQVEGLPHRRPVVLVAGQDVEGDAEGADQLLRQRVLLRRGVLGEVAGDEDRVDRVRQRGDRGEDLAQGLLRLHALDRRLAEVGVGDVGEDEGPGHGGGP
jgi:hypothetical protein